MPHSISKIEFDNHLKTEENPKKFLKNWAESCFLTSRSFYSSKESEYMIYDIMLKVLPSSNNACPLPLATSFAFLIVADAGPD